MGGHPASDVVFQGSDALFEAPHLRIVVSFSGCLKGLLGMLEGGGGRFDLNLPMMFFGGCAAPGKTTSLDGLGTGGGDDEFRGWRPLPANSFKGCGDFFRGRGRGFVL